MSSIQNRSVLEMQTEGRACFYKIYKDHQAEVQKAVKEVLEKMHSQVGDFQRGMRQFSGHRFAPTSFNSGFTEYRDISNNLDTQEQYKQANEKYLLHSLVHITLDEIAGKKFSEDQKEAVTIFLQNKALSTKAEREEVGKKSTAGTLSYKDDYQTYYNVTFHIVKLFHKVMNGTFLSETEKAKKKADYAAFVSSPAYRTAPLRKQRDAILAEYEQAIKSVAAIQLSDAEHEQIIKAARAIDPDAFSTYGKRIRTQIKLFIKTELEDRQLKSFVSNPLPGYQLDNAGPNRLTISEVAHGVRTPEHAELTQFLANLQNLEIETKANEAKRAPLFQQIQLLDTQILAIDPRAVLTAPSPLPVAPPAPTVSATTVVAPAPSAPATSTTAVVDPSSLPGNATTTVTSSQTASSEPTPAPAPVPTTATPTTGPVPASTAADPRPADPQPPVAKPQVDAAKPKSFFGSVCDWFTSIFSAIKGFFARLFGYKS